MSSHSISSTHWPEAMNSSSAAIDNDPTCESQSDLATVLARLEESLRRSQQALLGRDLGHLEEQTSVQTGLCRKLAACLPHLLSDNWDARAASCRVLHLGHVQQGLLRRAQRSARMLSHLMASPESGYADLAAESINDHKVVSHQEG